MYKLAEKEENTNAQAIALTMKALYLSNMTDLFGDMPFKEAFKGIDENIMQPKFDDQKVIYDSLLMDLERANTLYTKTSTIDAKRDLLYNGDVTKWRKFTNSLYLRLLMRVSNRRDMNSAERIKTVFENPSQYPIFESNDDNATLKYSGTRRSSMISATTPPTTARWANVSSTSWWTQATPASRFTATA